MIAVDLSGVVRSLSAAACQRVRRSGAYNAAGVFAVTTTSTDGFAAVVQPLTGRQRELLPEGIRQSARWRLHAADIDLRTDDAAGLLADQVVYLGRTYVAVEDKQHPSHGRYVRVILAELEA